MKYEYIDLTVTQLNLYVRSLLEGDVNLTCVNLVGELSNFKDHFASGHWYFVLKDKNALVRAVMFCKNAQMVNFVPKDGMRVICRGYVSLYEKDGQFQFYAETMRPFGQGDLAAEFERIKQLLKAEGLFDKERKKAILPFPKSVGIVTSESGAALYDILNILNRRYPVCNVVLFPAQVQGAGAPESLISALEKAYNYKGIDTLIIGRGGGSAEDLSCFNNEALARKIAVSPIPVISAVGHETDFTICDFVSDLRAPTPSAAAELAVNSIDELLMQISELKKRLETSFKKHISIFETKIEFLTESRVYKHPELLFMPFELRLERAIDTLNSGYTIFVKSFETRLKESVSKLSALSPSEVLNRGYSLTYKGNSLLNSVKQLKSGDNVKVVLSDGEFIADVKEIKKINGFL